MELANEKGIPVILDPAPYRQNLNLDYYKMADIITPNETEAEYMTGIMMLKMLRQYLLLKVSKAVL